jgi:hypothetical protein
LEWILQMKVSTAKWASCCPRGNNSLNVSQTSWLKLRVAYYCLA